MKVKSRKLAVTAIFLLTIVLALSSAMTLNTSVLGCQQGNCGHSGGHTGGGHTGGGHTGGGGQRPVPSSTVSSSTAANNGGTPYALNEKVIEVQPVEERVVKKENARHVMELCSNGNLGCFPCFIATATFGSPLAPQVQLLRSFRDNQLLSTREGWSFMIVFNAWYYSFSPAVGQQISSHPLLRIMMVGLLYPLLGIVTLSSVVFSATSRSPELAAFLSELLGTSLFGALYIGLPLGLMKLKVRWMRSRILRKYEMLLSVALLSSSTLVAVGEFWFSGALIPATWMAILSALLLSGSVTSTGILAMIRMIRPPRK